MYLQRGNASVLHSAVTAACKEFLSQEALEDSLGRVCRF
jgi:hypothetical protein